MIKTLLNADEEPPPNTKVVIEDTILNPVPETQETELSATEEKPENIEEIPVNTETREVFEIPEGASFFTKPSETFDETVAENEISKPEPEPFIETANEERAELKTFVAEAETSPIETPSVEMPSIDASTIETPLIDENAKNESDEKPKIEQEITIFQSNAKPETTGETIRQTGLAWSAGVVFFGSIVIMMIFGWFADQLLGSYPWGLVGGIVLGAVIGFIQFFRITSQIFKK